MKHSSLRKKSLRKKSLRKKSLRKKSLRKKSLRKKSLRKKSLRKKSLRKKSNRRYRFSFKSNRKCPEGKVLNPKTGRCVLKTSPLGKKIMKEKKGSRGSSRRKSSRKKSSGKYSSHRESSPSFKCKKTQILNPKTGRCVLKSGKIGQEILKKRNK